MKYPMFRKADILLAVLLLALGSGSLVLLREKPAENSVAAVYVDGKLTESCRLDQDKTLEISTQYGVNTLEIKDGGVRVLSSDCSGQDCVHMGWISKNGQLIMCLPHRLSVIIEGAGAPDSVVY